MILVVAGFFDFPVTWVILVIVDLVSFIPFDWGHGVLRASLLAALGALVWWWRAYPQSVAGPPSRRAGRVVVAFAAAGLAVNLGVGLHRFVSSLATGQTSGDQAQSVIAALRLVRDGSNPWSTLAATDLMAGGLAAEELTRRPECEAPPAALVASCAPLHRMFSALGFKYGPAMLVFYAPFVAALGAAGIALSHLLLFGTLVTVLGTRVLADRRSWWWTSLAVIPLLWTVHMAWNILDQDHLDLLPVLLAILGLLCMRRQTWALAALALGLSINAKLLPGLLFVPALLRAPRRFVVLAPTVALAGFLPLAILDWRGLWFNIGYPLMRAPDSSALAFLLPPGGQILLRVASVAALAAAGMAAHARGWNPRATLNWLLAAHLIVLGTGGTLHNNYLVWLLPLITLLVAAGPGPKAGVVLNGALEPDVRPRAVGGADRNTGMLDVYRHDVRDLVC